MLLLPLSPISFSEECRDILKRGGLNNDPSSCRGGQREKKKNNFTELALNIQRQSGESGQQMVAMMARKRWGGVRVDGEESEAINEDKGEESGNKGRVRGEGGAEITMAAYKQVEDRQRKEKSVMSFSL